MQSHAQLIAAGGQQKMFKPICCGFIMKFIGYDANKNENIFQCRCCNIVRKVKL